jgi:hypothetical protein
LKFGIGSKKAYEEVKHLSLHEQIKFIVAAAQPLTDVITSKLKKVERK